MASRDHSSSRCMGLSLSWPLLLRSTGSRRTGSVVVAHGPGCSAACGILPDQGSNPCPLHWQADSQPLHHQGNPIFFFIHRYCSLLLACSPPPFFFLFSVLVLFYLAVVVSIIVLLFLIHFFIFLILFPFLFFDIVLLLFFFLSPFLFLTAP